MMNPLISVIVPVFNVEQYLTKCVDSICNQKYSYLEILLIDDGSTDQSGNICEELSKRDSRIKVFHKKNGGLSDARNYGLMVSTGEYITFVDSDDYIAEDMINILYNNLKKEKANISVCGYQMVYDNKTVDIIDGQKMCVYNTDEAFSVLLQRNNIGVIACNKLYQRNLFNNVIFPVGKQFEDINTIYKVIHKAKKIVYEPISLYFYRQRIDSINGQSFKNGKFNQRLYDMESAADELYSFVCKNHIAASQNIAIGCADYYVRIITQEIIYKINNTTLRNKAKLLIKSNTKAIRKANYLDKKKKLQLLCFAYCYPIYTVIVKILKG